MESRKNTNEYAGLADALEKLEMRQAKEKALNMFTGLSQICKEEI